MAPLPESRRRFQFRLDADTGVPAYRQIIDQVTAAIARGAQKAGDQLPTVRQLAVDLSINPNTVIRAYRELEIRGVLETQQGTGTFISQAKPENGLRERERRLGQLVTDFLAKVGAEGFTVEEAIAQLQELQTGGPKRRK
ncbi:MAG: GntR family transcriptional regulator [Bryobacteraceae bacterium]